MAESEYGIVECANQIEETRKEMNREERGSRERKKEERELMTEGSPIDR